MPFLPYCTTVTLNVMANRHGKTRHFYPLPDFRGTVFGLLPLIVMSVVALFFFFLIIILYEIVEIPFIPRLLRV